MKKAIFSMALVAITAGCTAGNKQQAANAAPEEAAATETVSASKAEGSADMAEGSEDMAPDFTLNDIQGKPLRLSSLRGQYVVLDFWGSWCPWCIKGFPRMKEYYKKYEGKFEILGIDCNEGMEAWKASVEEQQLPWLHVYNPNGSDVLEAYGIQGFPTKVIIGPDGKVVRTIIGEDPAFYTLLDELFK